MTTRWGFVATGGIAAALARDLPLVEGAQAHAVASRDAGRARAFAAEHGFERSYGSYAALLADPDVDVVYVATPHAQHRAVATAALRAGKPVLVEKPLTCTAEGTAEVVALARSQGLFAMEALWTLLQPTVVRLRELLAEGAIGEVRTVTAHLGFRVDPDPSGRMLDPAQGGGGLLDLGIYPVALAQAVLGAPSGVQATGSLAATGVDADAGLLLSYDGGRQALLSTSVVADAPGTARIIGTRGWVDLDAPVYRPPRAHVHRDGVEAVEVVALPGAGAGYVEQLAHVQECLARGVTESPVVPLDATLAHADVLEQALSALGAEHRDDLSPDLVDGLLGGAAR